MYFELENVLHVDTLRFDSENLQVGQKIHLIRVAEAHLHCQSKESVSGVSFENEMRKAEDVCIVIDIRAGGSRWWSRRV